MSQNNRQFQRCTQCQIKPATIKRWINEFEFQKLCFNCDASIPETTDSKKEIIPYDEMLEQVQVRSLQQSFKKREEEIDPLQDSSGKQQLNTFEPFQSSAKKEPPIKEEYSYPLSRQSPKNRTPIKQEFKPISQVLFTRSELPEQIRSVSSQFSTRQKFNKHQFDSNLQQKDSYIMQIPEQINGRDLRGSEAKVIELKYRIRLQEQENTIQLLKSHLENLEQRNQENISRTKLEMQRTEEIAYKEQERHQEEIFMLKQEQEAKLQLYLTQIQQERNRCDQTELRLESLRKTHETKTIDLQQQISQLRAEVERLKLEKEKILANCDDLISQNRKQANEENERVLNEVKKEFSSTIADYREKLSNKMDEVLECRNQIQHLQATLREVETVWQRKITFIERENDELKQINLRLKEQTEKIENDKRNIVSEYRILQKEIELQQDEKRRQQENLKTVTEKHEKLEKFIYGGKKTQKKGEKRDV